MDQIGITTFREANENAHLSQAADRTVYALCTQCPFLCTFGLCSANIVCFLSCMLIHRPWQCVDRGSKTEEGQQEGSGVVGVQTKDW